MGLHEGVCNHLSFMVPGRDDLFLVNPDGWGFGEITASRLLICDFHRRVVAGDGVPEDTAFYIHARLHACLPRARAAFHTHMPNATALTMVEGDPLIWAGQSALKFYGRTVVDDAYNGLALDESEGDRIAASVGDADIVFMKHHGVLVLAPSIAKAWDDLYYLERACEVQRLAQSTGRVVVPVPKHIAEATGSKCGTKADGIRPNCIWTVSSGSLIVTRRSIASDPPDAFRPGSFELYRLHADRPTHLCSIAGSQGAAGASSGRCRA